jgi:hypothetical protein
MKLRHIVNPTEITESTKDAYLHIAQPVTLDSMLHARRQSHGFSEIDLCAITNPTETISIPTGILHINKLSRTCGDIYPELSTRKLPLIQDILKLGTSDDYDYYIYTNIDISVYPSFYDFVYGLIRSGHDSICINRKTLPKSFNGDNIDVSNYRRIVFDSDIHKSDHIGCDCFIFSKHLVPRIKKFGNIFVGATPIGAVFNLWLQEYSESFHWEKEATQTFHLGDDMLHARAKHSIYKKINTHNASKVYECATRRVFN